MGLDIYLRGEKFFWTNWDNPEKDRKEDGLRVSSLTVELGYWRKHPNLHGFIVQTFAKGRDECQRIELDSDKINQIISAVTERRLPHTEGFFFGKSKGSQEEVDDDLNQLKRALDWGCVKENCTLRTVYYQASW